MNELKNKIDFAAIVWVEDANPNGNRPRQTYEGYGEISDVCIKRKVRNRLQDMGEKIFVQSDERVDDGCKSLLDRAKSNDEMQKALKAKNEEECKRIACAGWIDVRSFGQVLAFKGEKKGKGKEKGDSVGIKGPVTIHSAFSVEPIDIDSIQITKSVNNETQDKKSSDRMGMKHKVHAAMYIIKGSINTQLAEKTGFSNADAEKIKEALRTLFVNDSSSARPDGSMEVYKIYWWKHNCPMGQYSSAKVHKLLKVSVKEGVQDPKEVEDYDIILDSLPGLEVEEIEGM